MTEFLLKTELLDSFADKLSQTVDIPTTIRSEGEIGFKNATFSWSVESVNPSQRTFRLHISGELLFKRDCINLIIGPTLVFHDLFAHIYEFNYSQSFAVDREKLLCWWLCLVCLVHVSPIPLTVNDSQCYRRDALHSINRWFLVQPSQKGRRSICCSRIMDSEWNDTK